MKRLRLVSAGIALALIAMLCFASVALAVPGSVTNFKANPTSTTIVLSWTVASGSTSTVVRYDTSGYPANPASGTSAYSGAGNQCTVSSLTAGTVYYFCAWGYDGADYSASPTQLTMNTLSVDIPTGEGETGTTLMPIPTVPANALQDPDASGFSLEPLTSIITFFNSSDGGLGMPSNNAWEVLAIFVLVAAGLGTYIKMKNFFVAYAVLFVFTIFFVGLDLVQGYLVAIELVIGAGVWAIERYMQ